MELQDGPHPERARLDSERLLLHVLGKDRVWLIANPRSGISSELFDRWSQLLERRQRGEPIQYIIGETEFYGLPFRVTPAVLIPRPETEHLVEKTIDLCRDIGSPRIVDVGTGSGAIAVALAHRLPQAQMAATDISAEALAVAKGNAETNLVAERIRFVQGDLLAPITGEQFDVVASNPPYVSSEDRDTLSVEVRDYEPETALFAGRDGIEIYRRLIPQAADALAAGGHVVMEIGFGQQESIRQLLVDCGYIGVEFVPDLQGIPRVAVARRP
ncbi:MAG TPA: peptide chain release factor N(5)-glutamine methyltransferase [Terracidiphilus sp.]